MISRRQLIVGASGAAFSNSFSWAQDGDDYANLRKSLEEKKIATLGPDPLPADDERWEKAKGYLKTAASKGVPYKMAEYLASSAVEEEFRGEWVNQTQANPLIWLLWVATNIPEPPEGDETAWCSTFMNWCLWKASPAIPIERTRNAASQSFLNWGTEVWKRAPGAPLTPDDVIAINDNARRGDICVFTDKSRRWLGHVAFFGRLNEKQPNTHIDILGGNQSNRIMLASFNMTGNPELMSIRTAEGLRNV
jgi:hypothetical protein